MEPDTIINKIKNHSPVILGSEEFTKYAVLLPLIEKDEGIHVLFETRAETLRRQPGEICFPGGRIDERDASPADAAVRETTEELGITRKDISDVHSLDYMVSPFGMIVYPFAGMIHNSDSIEPNPAEVGEVFTVPLKFFLETEPVIHHVNLSVKPEDDFPFDLIVGGENYNWRTGKIEEYFYIYNDYVIWGLTARILSHFAELIRD
ncbi:NUDIX hydrolase [Virgibacillus kekensis]|uniref:NUDIX hydrolase n=1 Tax=Virgibacillus kekensis TaxID=202261 RepID=A0ABV9DN27_9BACI